LYVASPAATDVELAGDRVARWLDRTNHHNDAVQTYEPGRPVYQPAGLNGQPTVHFRGQDLLRVPGWSGAPAGANAGFSVLAVVRSAAPQDACVVSWWDDAGGGNAWAGFTKAGEATFPDVWRAHELVWAQDYTGPHDLGVIAHVIAWRYRPSSQVLDVTVDGTKSSSTPFAPIANIPTLPLIIGARSTLPTGLLNGDISELVIVPTDLADADVQNFTAYARNHWSGLPTQGSLDPCVNASGRPTPATTRCDDGNAGTYGDHCSAGACVGQAPLPHSPAELSPIAWYHAGAPEVFLRDGLVSHWYDRTSHHLDLLEGFYNARPQLIADGWNAGSSNPKPTLHFTSDVLRRAAWTGVPGLPGGGDAEFTLLAVVQSLPSQDAGLASWWAFDGNGRASCRLQTSSTGPTLDLFRQDETTAALDFPDTRALDNGRHVLAWRYAPGLAKVTIDGSTVQVPNSGTLSLISGTEFLVGAENDLSYNLLNGDISELVVVPGTISDGEISAFNAYAQAEWGGLTLCTPSCGTAACGAPDGCGGACPCCDLTAPFNPPQPAFTGATIANGLTFSPDGLTAYVSAKATPSSPYAINVTTRTSTTAFGVLSPVAVLNGTEATAPAMTTDGLRLYFTKTASGGRDLVVSTRASTAQAFPAPQLITALNSASFHDQDPFFLSPTSELYFASEKPTGTRDLYVSKLTNGVYAPAAALSVNFAQAEDYRPVLSPNGRTLYFGSARVGIGGDTGGDMWVAQRSVLDQPFDASSVTNLWGLNSSYTDFPVTVTDGGCTLYFASGEETGVGNFPGKVRLYRATRGFSTPAAVTTTLNILGTGSVTTTPFQCSTSCSAQGAPESKVLVTASGSARWTGSCTSQSGQPSQNGVVVFTNDGVCTVDFRPPGNGSTGAICFNDTQCASGLFCISGVCHTLCNPSCAGKAAGAPNDCGVACGGSGIACSSSDACGGGLACYHGACTSCEGACGTQPPGGECNSDSDCADGVDCSDGICGGPNAACGTCAPGLTCESGNCKVPLGNTGCDLPTDCVTGATCINHTCMLPECLTTPQIECGFVGARCGPSCTPHPICTSDDDCDSGYHCPEDNGWRYGVRGVRVCEKPDCATTPEVLGCGNALSECGICYCAPRCEDKHCGDADMSDGCGGTCTNICNVGEPGCTNDSHCAGGVCRAGVCRPANPCGSIIVQPPDCGSVGSTCGPCLNPPPASGNRQCGVDPSTRADAGSCAPGLRCTAEGQCVASANTPPIVLTEGGIPRTVEPPPSPPSAVGGLPTVGAIPGTFDVTDRGTATYKIDIDVPPGGPITPELSLRYSSSSGNGALGVGWSLDGLSQISRCQRTFAQDGAAQPVKGTDDDALCLDGQRLERHIDEGTPAHYRTAVDTFTAILPMPSGALFPEWFVAYTKDGRILTYGRTGASTLANGQSGTWNVTRVEDRAGNFMTIDYNDFHPADANGVVSTAESLPTAITYGGRYNTVAGDRVIRFVYEDRPDKMLGWRAPAGSLFIRRSRLKSIELSAARGRVRSYELAYDVVRDTSRLKSLQECSSSLSLCKRPTYFDYFDETGFEDGKTTWVDCAQVAGGCNGPDARIVNGLNAYGFPLRSGGADHLATATILSHVDMGLVSFFDTVGLGLSILSLGGGAVLAATASMIQGVAPDMGQEDNEFLPLELRLYDTTGAYAKASYSWSGERVNCLMPARQPLLDAPLSADPTERLISVCPVEIPTGKQILVPSGHTGTKFPHDQTLSFIPRVWYVDIDGDGLQDRLTCASNGAHSDTTHLLVARATKTTDGQVNIPGSGGTVVTTPIAAFSDTCSLIVPSNNQLTYQAFQGFSTLLDVNGDGTSELVAADTHDHLAALIFDEAGTATWHEEYFSGVTASSSKRDYIVVMDVNGDGLRDLVALPDREVTINHLLPNPRTPRVAYNTGAGFVERSLSAADEVPVGAPQFAPIVMDYDHDGCDDLMEPVSAESRQWRLRHFKNNEVTVEPLPITTGPGTMGDFDGDGNPDLLTDSNSYPPGAFLFWKGRGRRDHLLKSVIDGMGRHVSVEYDGAPDTGTTSIGLSTSTWVPKWPIRVTNKGKTNQALVTTTYEGHYTRQPSFNSQTQRWEYDVNQFYQNDRQVDYKYSDWATDVAGYGPLGFSSRLIVERDGAGSERSRRLIEFNLTQPASTEGRYVRSQACPRRSLTLARWSPKRRRPARTSDGRKRPLIGRWRGRTCSCHSLTFVKERRSVESIRTPSAMKGFTTRSWSRSLRVSK
jgi:hypothetical protein